ncbi:MAG: 2-oxoacid:ferredoxin oxidoreductase subunit beta [Candidatus Woesearchaeota archaeon]|nr:MAG: 2-oxoacid:ferredoxin oxidoreductase subunit beta [Candidatus Woesearchaeota archaeon]
MTTVQDLKTPATNTWCPGCGNFGILVALQQAIVEMGWEQHEVLIVAGIGCSGHICNYVNTYVFEGLHGRPVPVAIGAKLANPNLHVIVMAGDGDTYGEGLNHFINGIRGNHDVTMIVHNNGLYALTTGQSSPASDKGFKSPSTPAGLIEPALNPLALALTQNGSFVARTAAFDMKQQKEVFMQAFKHKGFSFVEVMQHCVTFNHVKSLAFLREHVKPITGHDVKNRAAALQLALSHELYTGVFLDDERRKSYSEEIGSLVVAGPTSEPIQISDLMDSMK